MEKKDVQERLKSLGYECKNTDDYMLGFAMQAAKQHICNIANIRDVPEELSTLAVDMAAGEFLCAARTAGTLAGEEIEQIERSIKEGDTSVEYAEDMTPSQRIDAYINHMRFGREQEIYAFRRMTW